MADKQDLDNGCRWLDNDGAAFGGQGVAPRWILSKKDAVGRRVRGHAGCVVDDLARTKSGE